MLNLVCKIGRMVALDLESNTGNGFLNEGKVAAPVTPIHIQKFRLPRCAHQIVPGSKIAVPTVVCATTSPSLTRSGR
jgi:hypothetical protein